VYRPTIAETQPTSVFLCSKSLRALKEQMSEPFLRIERTHPSHYLYTSYQSVIIVPARFCA